MSEKYLACQIVKETTENRVVTGSLIDGSTFSAKVPFWDVVVEEKDDPNRRGWLLVELLGEDLDNQKSTVRLPAPDVNLGHNICVLNKNLRQIADVRST